MDQGLAVTVIKGSIIGPRLRGLSAGSNVPALPGAEIRLHRSGTLGQSSSLVADLLSRRLREMSLGS